MAGAASVSRTVGAVAGLVLLAALLLTGPPSAAQDRRALADGNPATTERLFARDAVTAGIAASRARFDDAGSGGRQARHAVLSRDDAFADSLAGAPLAGGGPLLFTGSRALTPRTADELGRVLDEGATVYLLGGQAALGEPVADALADAGYEVERLAGRTRVETALAVADAAVSLSGPPERVLLARAEGTHTDPTAGWADSVTAGGVAVRDGVPVLLTPTAVLHPAVAAWLDAHDVTETVLLGGTEALSDEVAGAVPGPRRLAGRERTETAAVVARALWDGTAAVTVTSGRHPAGWAFGLAAAGLAADAGSPLLLADHGVTPALRDLVASCGDPAVEQLVVGDGSVLSSRLREALDAYDGQACGPDGTLRFSAELEPLDACDGVLATYRELALERVGPYGLEGPYGREHAVPQPAVGEGQSGEEATDGDSGGSPAPAAPRSGTNLQELGVDEPDIVKDNGELALAVAQGRLQIVDLAGDGPALTATVDLPSDTGGHELLLSGDTAVVLSSSGFSHGPIPVDGDVSPMSTGQPARTLVTTLDVGDPHAPRVVSTSELDGSYRSARMVGTTVRLVLQSQPHDLAFTAPAEHTEEAHAAAAEHNRQVVREAPISAWLPGYRVDGGAEQPLVDCADVRRPPWQDGVDTLAVATFEAGSAEVTSSAAVVGAGQTTYASPDNLVVATSRWNATEPGLLGEAVSTELHAFAIDDPAATTYVGSGSVPGHLLNQFSLSEHEGFLRVATTSEPPWDRESGGPGQQSSSAVRVLDLSDPTLAQVGLVDGLGLGEQIFAVRFMGDLGAVVTFRRIDPLYLLDLSDPRTPAVTGELKITGFSSYLHRVGPQLLLGVGQEATEEGRTIGTQLSLFDITDRSAPRRVSQLQFGEGYTEAQDDHKAFLHWAPADLAVLPLAEVGDGGQFLGAVGVGLADATLTERGRADHRSSPDDYRALVRRAFVVGDTLYTVSGAGLEAGSLTDLSERAFVAFQGDVQHPPMESPAAPR